MSRSRGALAAFVAAIGIFLVAGCGSPHPQGPAGQVTDHDKDQDCRTTGTGAKKHRTCTWDYELTVRTPDGGETDFAVDSAAYDHCYRGSAYPKCIDN